MAWEKPLFDFSGVAAKDLSSRIYQVVRYSTGDKITFVSSGKVAPIGILQDEPTSGMIGHVMVLGISKVKVGGAVSRNQLLGIQITSTSAPGYLVAATTASKNGTRPVGRALQGAAQAGDIIPALINFFPVGLATS